MANLQLALNVQSGAAIPGTLSTDPIIYSFWAVPSGVKHDTEIVFHWNAANIPTGGYLQLRIGDDTTDIRDGSASYTATVESGQDVELWMIDSTNHLITKKALTLKQLPAFTSFTADKTTGINNGDEVTFSWTVLGQPQGSFFQLESGVNGNWLTEEHTLSALTWTETINFGTQAGPDWRVRMVRAERTENERIIAEVYDVATLSLEYVLPTISSFTASPTEVSSAGTQVSLAWSADQSIAGFKWLLKYTTTSGVRSDARLGGSAGLSFTLNEAQTLELWLVREYTDAEPVAKASVSITLAA